MEKITKYIILSISMSLGAYVPVLLGGGLLGGWSLLGGLIGGFVGVYVITRLDS